MTALKAPSSPGSAMRTRRARVSCWTTAASSLQQQLARGDGLGEAQREQLGRRGRLGVLLGDARVERGPRLFGALEVELGAEFAEGVDGEAEVFGGAVVLREGGVGATEPVVRAGAAVAVAEHVEDREAATEVVRGERRVLLPEREHAEDALRLAGDGDVGRRVGGLGRDLLQERGGLLRVAVQQVRLGQQQRGLAHGLAVADALGDGERFFAAQQRVVRAPERDVAARQRPHRLRQSTTSCRPL